MQQMLSRSVFLLAQLSAIISLTSMITPIRTCYVLLTDPSPDPSNSTISQKTAYVSVLVKNQVQLSSKAGRVLLENGLDTASTEKQVNKLAL
jgi:hypothetical protein